MGLFREVSISLATRQVAKAKERVRENKLLTLGVVVLGVIGVVIVYYAVVTVVAYEVTPQLYADYVASHRMPLRLESLPPRDVEILLAVEDPNFMNHHGIDLSTPGAGYTTITQGLAKQVYFVHFRSGIAKVKQSLYAMVLDRLVTKQDQLKLFINTVYMGTLAGKPVNGLSDAARVYFGKDFGALTEDQYIALVAMIVGPDGYSVVRFPARNAERVRRIKKLLRGECKPSGLADVYYEGCK
ncbi:MAG: transglycosylase domain-containing protein [Acidobacteriia bacterium]|nr:transglycosylase domain-containing protein [Terriglobia bacterium]